MMPHIHPTKTRGRWQTMISVLALLLGFSSCSETDYMSYDPTACGVYFNHDTLTYSFSVTPVETTEYVLNVPVKVMGVVSQQARTFSYSVEKVMPSDSLQKLIYIPEQSKYEWATEGVEYSLPTEVTIPAGAIEGCIPVTIHRRALKGNFSEGYKRYRIVLRLKANNNFTPVLSEKDQVRIVQFDNAIDQPAWYNYDRSEKIWYKNYLGSWHPYTFIKLVEYFHELKSTLPETYKKIVELYGENLEHVPYGDFHEYRTIFRKHVFKRVYDHINDPSNRDMILSIYPDYPFDFPNPF